MEANKCYGLYVTAFCVACNFNVRCSLTSEIYIYIVWQLYYKGCPLEYVLILYNKTKDDICKTHT